MIEVEGVGKCHVVNSLWFVLPDWQNHVSVYVGIVIYINEHYQMKRVIGVCNGANVDEDIKMVIAGGVPCHVAIN